MPSKLGGHFMQNGDPQRWIDAGAAVYKFAPEVLGASAAVPVGPLVIGKLDQHDPALNLTDWKALMKQSHTPQSAADLRFLAQTNIYVGPNKPPVNRYAANPRVDVWEDDNEVPPDNATEAAWYSAYCIAMMRHYEGIDARRANFSFAVGTPDTSIWPHLLPAVRYARDNGHYLALHEYMGYEADYGVGWRQVDGNRQPTTDVWHGRPDKVYPWGWAALRYRYIYDTVFAPAGLGDVKLLITECGCDSVESVTPAGMPTGSWRAMGLSPDKYAGMLEWYDARLREDPYVAGATVFTVGSVGIWKDWDIAGTPVEAALLAYIPAVADDVDPPTPDPPTPPTEPPVMSTQLLINPSFDDGWTDDDEYPATLQNPNGWDVLWNLDATSERSGAKFLLGEGVHRDTFPPDELGVLKWDGQYSYKLFAAYRPIWPRIKQALTLPAGQYLLRTPVFVDCFHWKGYKDFNLDPLHCETMVKANGVTVRDWTLLTPGQRNETETTINHAGGPLELAVHFRAHWAIANNGFFLDGWSLSPVTVAPPPPPPPPPPGKHRAIVVKLPQGATVDEWRKAAEYSHAYQHTMTASHDDMLTILHGGNAESYVKLAWPDKQPDVGALITTAGYSWEPLFYEPPVTPFAFAAYPVDAERVVTQAFGANPEYYKQFGFPGGHEGIDLKATLNAPVRAVAAGVVSKITTTGNYGYRVDVSHPGGWVTTYAHLSKFAGLDSKGGDEVAAGQVIGYAGSTGNSTGVHLHLGLKREGYIYKDDKGLSWPFNIFDPTPYLAPFLAVDLLPYLQGDGRIYEVRHPSGATETFQTQADDTWWYLVKNSQWEQLYADATHIWRGADTSPGGGRFYVQFEPGLKRARWMPRYMSVGQTWVGPGHYVQFYDKATCAKSAANSGNATNRMTFVARHASRTWNGITVPDVVELTNGTEIWFFARGFGLVAWSSAWGASAICAVYAPGERAPLVRETVNCTW